jgi:hypothetical protein
MKAYIDKAGELGLMVEKIIVNYLSESGRKISQSLDKFNPYNDIESDGKKIEVKTQIPFWLKKSFTIGASQLKKCKSVDELYFVSVPNTNTKYSTESDGWIYLADPKKFEYKNWTDKEGVEKIIISFDQPALVRVRQLSVSEIKELQKYTSSSY